MFRTDITLKGYCDAYLDDLASREPPLSGKTIRNYRWALKWLTDVYQPALPREGGLIIEFVRVQERLAPYSRQTLYDRLREFYSWMRTRYLGADHELPSLPYVSFGRRKRGEKRGGGRPWQDRA